MISVVANNKLVLKLDSNNQYVLRHVENFTIRTYPNKGKMIVINKSSKRIQRKVSLRSGIIHQVDPQTFSNELDEVLSLAQIEAATRFAYNISGPFIISAILLYGDQNSAFRLLHSWEADMVMADKIARRLNKDFSNTNSHITPSYIFDAEANKILEYAHRYALYFGEEKTKVIHVIMAMFRYTLSESYFTLNEIIPGFDDLEKVIEVIRPNMILSRGYNGMVFGRNRSSGLSELEADTEDIIEAFGVDLSEKVADLEDVNPVVGRDKEIDRIIRVLSRKTKNNPCLIGEPGVGKTAIAEGLAFRINHDLVPDFLLEKHVLNIEITKLVAGSKYRGDFESRLLSIVEVTQWDPNVLLFIDEIHTIMGAGSTEGALDAANILKPALSRGELKLIGATTEDEFRKYIQADGALERRFQAIRVPEPTEKECAEILHGIKLAFGNYHGVVYSDEAVEACVRFSKKYILNKFLPDKAIDLLDESGATVSMKGSFSVRNLEDYKFLLASYRLLKDALRKQDIKDVKKCIQNEIANVELAQKVARNIKAKMRRNKQEMLEKDNIVHLVDVQKTVEEMLGIKLVSASKSEAQKLINLEDILKNSVIGQPEAVSAVAKAIKRARVGLRDTNKPVASFIFAGPTGVGKTELAKALSRSYYGSEDAMIRIDCGDLTEKHSIAKLLGSPPGYIGFTEGGKLTEDVKKKPHSLVLFDECEKADKTIWQSLLPLFDEGKIKDTKQNQVDFTNTVLVMTSNLGVKEINNLKQKKKESSPEFSNVAVTNEEEYQCIAEAIADYFRPEFLNRIDEIIIFKKLEEKHIFNIYDIFIKDMKNRAAGIGVTFHDTPRLKKFVVEAGYNEDFGARPLKRTITNLVEDPLTERILTGDVERGDEIVADCISGVISYIKVDYERDGSITVNKID